MRFLISCLLAILPVVVTIVLFNINNEKPKIVYTVSENIPIHSSEDSQNNNIQQIEVKNTGNKLSEEIQIKINGEILNSKVIKDSESDEVEVFPENFELVYSELPPQGSFKLIVESNLNGLNEEILTIKSQEGLARNALDNSDNTFIDYLIVVIIPLVYFTLMGYSIRNIQMNYLVRKLSLKPYDNLNYMYKKKPFYFKEENWRELINRFIKEKIRNDLNTRFIHDIENLNSYYLLTNEKPNSLGEEDWKSIKEEAEKTLLINVQGNFLSPHTDDSLSKFISNVYDAKLNLSERLNLELTEILSSNYVRYKKNRNYYSTEIINKELTKEQPIFVDSNDWEGYISYLNNLQYGSILNEIFRRYNDPIEKIDEYQAVLPRENETSLREMAYNIKFYRFVTDYFLPIDSKIEPIDKPSWMKASDYQEIEKITKIIHSLREEESNIEGQFQLINKAINEENLPAEKPYYISELHWKNLNTYLDTSKKFNKIEEHLNKKEYMLNEREEKLNNKKEDVEKLKDKIEKQLITVNEFLNDPTVLERIESYNNVFAPGNFDNLTQLAKSLKLYGVTKA